MNQSELYKKIINHKNIFYSIYSIESYIFEKELLEPHDYELLIKLKDKFDDKLISNTIEEVKKKLDNVLLNDDFFETSVYFRAKKVLKDKNENTFIDVSNIISRPLHVADLYTQIAIASILNALLLEESNGKIELSELGRILPKNFYGNIPSENPSFLFEPWQQKYKEYSNITREAYSRYLETKEYSHEIMIDLENFFPSIQPMIVYKRILEVLAVKYLDKELECLKIAILKLLYMKVPNCVNENYYHLLKGVNYDLNINYTQGIPQGLPQSYLFGNICMMDVACKYDEVFEGEAYYYVDDSVIYTNIFKGEENLKQEFELKLEELNTELNCLNIRIEDIESELPKNTYINEIKRLNEILDYKIRAHSSTGKSEISEINNEKIGNPHLRILGKIASLSSFELSTTFSDFEEITLKNKFFEFKRSIEGEIERIDNISEGKQNFDNYKKYLIRYKKFMKFRERLLVSRAENVVDKAYIKGRIDKFKLQKNNEGQVLYENIESFFREYSEDILLTEILFMLKNNYNPDVYNEFLVMINEFDDAIYCSQLRDKAYFSKIIKNLTVKSNLFLRNFNRYSSLQEKIDILCAEFRDKHTETRKKTIDLMIENIQGDRRKFFTEFDNAFSSYFEWVNMGSDELYRQVLNVYTSKIYGIYTNDNIKINRIGNRPLLYTEFRIIVFIRNRYFKFDDFILLANEMKKEHSNCILDYTILDVIDYYVSFTRMPIFVDHLIQIHKYTNEIWKNGSKFLHFYTLHNHEHAIELIKGVIAFLKNVDYFQISKTDYYILFISCYLHDISMVLHPDLIKVFTGKENWNSNIITSSFQDGLSELITKSVYHIDSKELKEILIQYYKKIDQFFEETVRDKHAIDSARFIRKTNDIDFIDKTIRDIVAEISEAHGYDTIDIYDVKSTARDSLVSKKYLKILLRIADLLDVSDNRVANAVLINNNSYMSETTLFHWISHQAISGYDIETSYENRVLNNKNENISCISKGAILETITIVFHLNVKYYVGVDKGNCDFCKCTLSQQDKVKLTINADKGNQCSIKNCNFVCRWMVEKNKYLFKELFALQKYLKRSSSNFFETVFEVKFKCNPNARFLRPEEYNLIKKYIN
jgi:hypothetical protein